MASLYCIPIGIVWVLVNYSSCHILQYYLFGKKKMKNIFFSFLDTWYLISSFAVTFPLPRGYMFGVILKYWIFHFPAQVESNHLEFILASEYPNFNVFVMSFYTCLSSPHGPTLLCNELLLHVFKPPTPQPPFPPFSFFILPVGRVDGCFCLVLTLSFRSSY